MVSSQVNLGLPLAILQKAIISEATWKEKSSNKATSSYISSIKLKANFLLYIKFFFFFFFFFHSFQYALLRLYSPGTTRTSWDRIQNILLLYNL